MSTPRYHSDPSIYYLYQVLEELAAGSTRVPRFQRPFVWTDEQRLELLRSVFQGIPIGSILVWRTDRKIPTHEQIGPCSIAEDSATPGSVRSYLLDGLQRLSTLMSALQSPPMDEGGSTPPSVWIDEEGRQWIVYFDLDKQDFHIPRTAADVRSTWVPLHIILDNMKVLQWQQERLSTIPADVLARISVLARALGTYKLPLIPIVTDNIDQATLIFQRINSQGTSMSDVHMANALSWSEGFDLLEKIEAAREALNVIGWSGVKDELVFRTARLLLGFEAYGKNQDKVSKTLKENNAWLDEAARALRRAAEFLRDRCMIGNLDMLPYNMHIVVLAAAFHGVPEPTQERQERLRDWFWMTSYAQVFVGTASVRPYVTQAENILRGKSPGRWRKRGDLRLAQLPTAPDSHGVRGIALKIRLAELGPLDVNGRSIDARALLTRRGREGLPRLLNFALPTGPSLQMSPRKPLPVNCSGNLMLAEGAELEALRARLVDRSQHIQPGVLASHAIPAPAYQALRGGDVQKFLRLRSDEINQIEQRFFKATYERYSAFSTSDDASEDEAEAEEDDDA